MVKIENAGTLYQIASFVDEATWMKANGYDSHQSINFI